MERIILAEDQVWISVGSYFNLIKQAAENDGIAIIHSRGSDPLMVKIDPGYAKKEWSEIEKEIERK